MRQLHKFLHLSSPDKLLLLKSFFILVAIRVGLKLLPFQTLRRFLLSMTPEVDTSIKGETATLLRVNWAVETASQFVPAMTCLTQALATHLLLSRRGQPASLRIGVIRNLQGNFQAHAWVESQGRIVIGKIADLHSFTVLPPLEQ